MRRSSAPAMGRSQPWVRRSCTILFSLSSKAIKNSKRKENIMTERIGFVGVGRMGANMARRLKDMGYPVVAVYDVRPQAAQALAQELGCRAATSLAEVTEASDVILTVVTDDKAMQRIYAPPKTADSLLANARGKLFINCATI